MPDIVPITESEKQAPINPYGRAKLAVEWALQDYAADRGALFTPYYGEDAHERAMGMVRQNAWLLYEAGKAQNDPAQFGIEKPGAM